jgi:hypothetical protein
MRYLVSVTAPLVDARELYDEAMTLVAGMLEWNITGQWEAGTLPRASARSLGGLPGGDEAMALLGQRPPTAEGLDRLAALESTLELGWERLAQRRAATAGLPFDRLARAFGLSPTEERVIWLLVAVETRPRLRQLLRYAQGDAQRRRAEVGFLEEVVYGRPAVRDLALGELAPDGRLFRHRLVELDAGGEPAWSMRQVHAAQRVVELALGVDRLDPQLAGFANLTLSPAPAPLLLPEGLRDRVRALVAAGRGDARAPILVVAGREGSGRRSLLGAAAADLGLPLLGLSAKEMPAGAGPAIAREAQLYGALLVVDHAEPALEGALRDLPVPIALTQGAEDRRPPSLGREVVLIDVPPLGEAARETLWHRALGEAPIDFARLAARYAVTGGILRSAARAALALAAARGGAVTEEDVRAGVRGVLDEKIASLGTRVLTTQTWDDVVLPDETREPLGELVLRIRHRRRVFDEWGFADKLGKGLGLTALFAGPPGTGKTMVAALVARDLGLELYQIELSRVVSKYIGETEKNLAEVFDAAETGHSILLFDEADSLFAQRGEVKSSTDRYANLEVNYLLQRMERFRGITILTTNLASSIDPAFLRRVAFKIDFPMPEAPERERLWRAMFPAAAAVDDDVDFAWLADRYAMSGGHIRNAVLRAAFYAASEDRAIARADLVRAGDVESATIGNIVVAR